MRKTFKAKTDVAGRCLNCRAKLTGPFCFKCGQSATVQKYTPKTFSREVYNKFRKTDGISTYRTFIALTVRPGRFVSRYLDGKRVGYTAPIAYFFYFFVVEIFARSILFRLTGNAELGNTSGDNLEMQIITLVSTIFWGCLWYLFYKHSPLNLTESIIAAIYFVAQVNVFSLGVLIVTAPFVNRWPAVANANTYAEIILYFAYGIFFCRRLFHEPYWKLGLKQLGLSLLFLIILLVVVLVELIGSETVNVVTESPVR